MGFAAAMPWLISGLGALGGLFGNRSSQQQQSGTSNSTTAGGTGASSQSYPEWDALGGALRGDIITNYMQLLQNPLDLSGYQANATANINRNSNLEQQRIRETLASRGIVGDAADAAVRRSDSNRFSAVTNLQNSMPLMDLNLRQQILQGAGGFFNAMPYGTSTGTTGYSGSETNTNQTGTVTNPGNMLGGTFGSLAAILANLYGQGAFGGGNGTAANYNATTQSRVP